MTPVAGDRAARRATTSPASPCDHDAACRTARRLRRHRDRSAAGCHASSTCLRNPLDRRSAHRGSGRRARSRTGSATQARPRGRRCRCRRPGRRRSPGSCRRRGRTSPACRARSARPCWTLVDDRQLGRALVGLGQQPLRLVEQARVLEGDAHARRERAQQPLRRPRRRRAARRLSSATTPMTRSPARIGTPSHDFAVLTRPPDGSARVSDSAAVPNAATAARTGSRSRSGLAPSAIGSVGPAALVELVREGDQVRLGVVQGDEHRVRRRRWSGCAPRRAR